MDATFHPRPSDGALSLELGVLGMRLTTLAEEIARLVRARPDIAGALDVPPPSEGMTLTASQTLHRVADRLGRLNDRLATRSAAFADRIAP